MRSAYVYIMTNKPCGTIYVGVTSNLVKRICIHKQGINKTSFTCKYKLTQLVFYEEFPSMLQAIIAEKKLKKWDRKWKLRLISQRNPKWEDLSKYILPQDII